MRRLLLITAALLASISSVAQAEVRYPGQRAAHEPTLEAMVATAAAYWDAHGVFGCVPALDVADSLDGAAGRAWPDECRIALEAGYAGMLLEQSRRALRGWRYGMQLRLRRGPLADLCSVVVHEVGHTRGLVHTHDGVMDAVKTEVPSECRALSRRLIRRKAGSTPRGVCPWPSHCLRSP